VTEVNEISLELERLSRTFSANVLDSTKTFGLTLTEKAEVEGLAAVDLARAAQSAKVSLYFCCLFVCLCVCCPGVFLRASRVACRCY